MTPKQKATILFNKMFYVDSKSDKYPESFDFCKKCSIVAVDEIINNSNASWIEVIYWNEVKQEIEKL